jgi:hypothetical protein
MTLISFDVNTKVRGGGLGEATSCLCSSVLSWGFAVLAMRFLLGCTRPSVGHSLINYA